MLTTLNSKAFSDSLQYASRMSIGPSMGYSSVLLVLEHRVCFSNGENLIFDLLASRNACISVCSLVNNGAISDIIWNLDE
jgi:hypothetical protein